MATGEERLGSSTDAERQHLWGAGSRWGFSSAATATRTAPATSTKTSTCCATPWTRPPRWTRPARSSKRYGWSAFGIRRVMSPTGADPIEVGLRFRPRVPRRVP
ncbi:MAG: hypothetical protein R3F11_23035 [Verrucomicrobiales bacterium]